MSGYLVVLRCHDCTGVDFQGCNDGKPWVLEDDDGEARVFATYAEADDAGFDAADSPWEHKVVNR